MTRQRMDNIDIAAPEDNVLINCIALFKSSGSIFKSLAILPSSVMYVFTVREQSPQIHPHQFFRNIRTQQKY